MAAITSPRAHRRAKPKWIRRTKQGIALFAIIFLACFAGFFFIFLSEYRQAQDSMGTLDARISQMRRDPTVIVSADGKILYKISEQFRIPIQLKDVPKHVQNAVLAAEDKRFYDHSGVDPQSIGRAVWAAAKDRRVSQGGSTLTMQLAKRLYNGDDKSFSRKLKDIAVATAMETKLTKDQILEVYLNQVYFGEHAYGIEAASRVYFNKSVKDLTVAEAAMIARCVRLPSRENPIRDLETSVENRNVVLAIMRAEDLITEEEYREALDEKPKINKKPRVTSASYADYGKHFVNHVLDLLRRDFPEIDFSAGGYRIETTLDSKLQQTGEKVVRQIVNENRGRGVTTGAFVVMDRNGQILCEVGGVDFERNQYNMIYQGRRQPGSSFKPFVYGVALSMGAIRPGESLPNTRINIKDTSSKSGYWNPKNSNERSFGSYVPLETAFAYSVNRPAIHTMMKIPGGPATVVNYAKTSFGFRSQLDPVLPLALGSSAVNPLEMAEAYSTFMLRGDRVRPYPVVRIIDPDGEIMKSYEAQRFTAVMDPVSCEEIDQLLRRVVERGTGTRASGVPNARGKTGTTDSAMDAWFCGYTDGLVGIGWVANERLQKGKPAKYSAMASGVYGGTVTVQIWAGIMKEAHKRFAKPDTGQNAPPANAFVPPKVPQEEEPPTGPEPLPEDERPIEVPAPPDDQDPIITPADDGTDDQTPVQEPVVVPPPEPRRETPRREPPRREIERYVEVEVCVDTGLRASAYCPETVVRPYREGREPRRSCRLHGA